MTTTNGRRLGAVVLAGGRSSRFGRDKLAEPVEGRPLLHHAIDAVRSVQPGMEVVVVGAPGTAPVLPPDVRMVHDPRAFDGPLAGLATGLAALDPEVDRAIVVGGDMPGLVPAVLRRLVAALDADAGVDLALLGDDTAGVDGTGALATGALRARPLPAGVRCAPTAAAAIDMLASGERRLRALVARLTTEVIPSATWRALDPAGATLRDVDVPDDLPPAP